MSNTTTKDTDIRPFQVAIADEALKDLRERIAVTRWPSKELVEDRRVTIGRATAAGAGSGAWFGLFIGLLVGLFTTGPEWLGLVLGGLVIGAVWGAVFGFVAHRAMRGRRDFSSTSGIVAGRYDVTVSVAYVERARQALS